MSIISNIPVEILNYKVIPHLTVKTKQYLCLVSKAFHAIIQDIARMPQDNITLAGERDPLPPDPNRTTISYFRQLQKMLSLTERPKLFESIEVARKAMGYVQGNPLNVGVFMFHALKSTNCCVDPELALALVPFDYHTNGIPAVGNFGLGNSLICAIELDNPELVRAVLCHSNAILIPEKGPEGLETALCGALKSGNIEIVKLIHSHRNAGDPLFGVFLEKAIRENNLKHVHILLAANIGNDVLENALYLCADDDVAPEIGKAIFSHPNVGELVDEDQIEDTKAHS